jgi:hypothetical protein
MEFRQLRGMVANLHVYHGGGGNIMIVGSQGSGKKALVAALAEFGLSASMLVLRSELRDHASELRDQHRAESKLRTKKKFDELQHRGSFCSYDSSLSQRSELSARSQADEGSIRMSQAAGETTPSSRRASQADELFTPGFGSPPLPVVQRSNSLVSPESSTDSNAHRGSVSSANAAALAVRFGAALKRRALKHDVRQILPITADIAAQVLKNGASALGVGPAEFVRDTLYAADAEGRAEGGMATAAAAVAAVTETVAVAGVAGAGAESGAAGVEPLRASVAGAAEMASPPLATTAMAAETPAAQALPGVAILVKSRAHHRWGVLRAVLRFTLMVRATQSAPSLHEHGWLLGELLNDEAAVSLLPPPADPPPLLGLGEKCRLLLRMVLSLLCRLALAPSAPRLMLLLHLDS